VNSFLGGAVGFGADTPSYGDVGPGYTGDFFNTSAGNQGGIGSSILGGLGRGVLSGLSGLTGETSPSYSRGGPYTNQTKNDMQNLLALAFRSFETPRSTI